MSTLNLSPEILNDSSDPHDLDALMNARDSAGRVADLPTRIEVLERLLVEQKDALRRATEAQARAAYRLRRATDALVAEHTFENELAYRSAALAFYPFVPEARSWADKTLPTRAKAILEAAAEDLA